MTLTILFLPDIINYDMLYVLCASSQYVVRVYLHKAGYYFVLEGGVGNQTITPEATEHHMTICWIFLQFSTKMHHFISLKFCTRFVHSFPLNISRKLSTRKLRLQQCLEFDFALQFSGIILCLV